MSNMKRLLQVAVVGVSLQAVAALGAHPDNGPGCGLGKLAWSDYDHQKSIAPQVMMATTNGTFGSQTFGISSGTSGCTNDGTVMAEHKARIFANVNFDNLSQEMAQGHGEHLAALATLLGVPKAQHEEFFAMTQRKYTSLVASGEESPAAMLEALHAAMNQHPVLAKVSASR